MELYIYDPAMTLLGIIDEIGSLVWTRRYWSCGEFSLLVPMTEKHASLLKLGRIIVRRDSDEAGQIRYRHIAKDAEGLENIEIQGMFLSHWIGKRLIIPMLSVEAGTHELLARIVNDNLVAPADPRRAIPNLVIGDLPGVSSESYAYTSEEFAGALDVCEARAQLAKLGFKITTDPKKKLHTFKVYKGVDRTSGQTSNSMCVFSPDFDNVLEQEFSESNENVATAIYLQSDSTLSTEAREPVEVSNDSKVGLDRVEFFYSASDIASGEQSLDYTTLLTAKGHSVLADKVESVSFSSKINPSSHQKYKVDYDVGDRVTCLNRRWGVKIDARITEVEEAYESGKAEVTITFGTSLPTLSDKLKWR